MVCFNSCRIPSRCDELNCRSLFQSFSIRDRTTQMPVYPGVPGSRLPIRLAEKRTRFENRLLRANLIPANISVLSGILHIPRIATGTIGWIRITVAEPLCFPGTAPKPRHIRSYAFPPFQRPLASPSMDFDFTVPWISTHSVSTLQ